MTAVLADRPVGQQDTEPELAPGTLLRLTGEMLEAAGISVAVHCGELIISPRPQPRSKKQARENGAAQWTITVGDDAAVQLCFTPYAESTSDPRWVADIAAALLTSTLPDPAPPLSGPASVAVIGIKGVAGLNLRARGFRVRLNVDADDATLELTSDVAATTADSDDCDAHDAGTVWISDNGSIFYERAYWAGPSAARAIADTVTAAVRAAQPRRTAS